MTWATLHITCLLIMAFVSVVGGVHLVRAGVATIPDAFILFVIGPMMGSMVAAIIFYYAY